MHLTVKQNQCITPKSTDKSIYYMTLMLPESDSDHTLEYQAGDWLTVHPINQLDIVDVILALLNLTGLETIRLRRVGEVMVKEALQQHIEITQLNPAILNKLQRQLGIGDWNGRPEMMAFSQGKDIIDLLELYPELQTQGVDFLNWLSPLSPRYYSIASAPINLNEVSILYKSVEYQNQQRTRFGVASTFLKDKKTGDTLHVEIKANPMFKLPERADAPIIMIGAGTGLAPFIGFMQQRANEMMSNTSDLLFFGETTQKTNCLFCEEFKEWERKGLVDTVYAFSRDQASKVYVQDRLLEQSKDVWTRIEKGAHIYICGSQDKLAESVKQVFIQIFQECGQLSQLDAEQAWQDLREQKRVQMDVY